jgi:DNA-binding response OmpR family regulator
MHRSRSALVVAASPGLAAHLSAWLKPAGWRIFTANSYAAAKSRLELGADLLVTELELGDYNGLQLALRAQSSGVPTVVVGQEDSVLEREAEQLGSVYLRKTELDEHRLLVAIDAKLASLTLTLPAMCRNVEFARRPWAVKPSVSSRRILLN